MMNTDMRNLLKLRADGRKKDEQRNIECKIGTNSSANGSSHFKIGLTEIICAVYGPKQATRDNENLVEVEYTVATFAGIDRRTVSKADKDWSEFAENLRVSFENLICKEVYPKSQIHILVTIVQSDGSTKSAIFNAICLALLDAGIAMKDFMVACTTGILNYDVMIDLTNQEQMNSNGELTISYQPKTEKIVFMELKSSKTTKGDFEKLLETNIEGCRLIYDTLKQFITENAVKKLVCSR